MKKCPKCKSEKFTISDYQPLGISSNEEDAQKNDFYFENEIYATVTCWDCGWSKGLIAKIEFPQPTYEPSLPILNGLEGYYNIEENTIEYNDNKFSWETLANFKEGMEDAQTSDNVKEITLSNHFKLSLNDINEILEYCNNINNINN